MPDATPVVSRAQQRAIDAGKLVETVNALSYKSFTDLYCDPDVTENAIQEIDNLTDRKLDVILLYAEHLKDEYADILDACFSLVEASSANDYKLSEMKWSASSKRKEMILPDMRYMVIRDEMQESDDGTSRAIHGFVSFMTTYEDGYEVLYVYEIHLAAKFRGQGVGKVLLDMTEAIGRKIKLEKVMLTVFKSNNRAVKWYDRMGYTVDDFSPGPRVLRNGTIKEPSYVILSKPLR